MANVLSVPNVVISMFNLLLITVISELVNNRTAVCMLEDIWFLPFYIALVVLPATVKPWTWFTIAQVVSIYSHILSANNCDATVLYCLASRILMLFK